MNPELMLALINNLTDRAACIQEERGVIRRASEDNSNGDTPPVLSVDDLSDVVSTVDGVTTLYGAAEDLGLIAEELSARRDEVVYLNSSGITERNPDGTMSYYLPTPAEGVDPASVDTIENVRAYNSQAVENARAEAEELAEAISVADGVSSQGRTADEILAQIEKHEDIPTYGASFVNTIGGAQRYLVLIDIVERAYSSDIERIENAVGILGHVLGAASQDEVGGGKLGEEFGNVLTKSSSAGDVAPFNALVDRPDVTYGTQFLVMAADYLEDIDPASILPGNSRIALEYSPDPLTGVLNAMSRNPEAALEYLAGEGTVDAEGNWVPSEDNKERWANLTTRDWNADPMFYFEQHTGADGLTAALGAASAYRNPDPDQPEARPGADAAATYVAGQGISYFGSDSWSKNDFTETMKENLAVLMANSPEELVATALGADWSKYGDGPHLGTWG